MLLPGLCTHDRWDSKCTIAKGNQTVMFSDGVAAAHMPHRSSEKFFEDVALVAFSSRHLPCMSRVGRSHQGGQAGACQMNHVDAMHATLHSSDRRSVTSQCHTITRRYLIPHLKRAASPASSCQRLEVRLTSARSDTAASHGRQAVAQKCRQRRDEHGVTRGTASSITRRYLCML